MDTAELEWIAWTNPITTAFGSEIAAKDLSGRTVSCHQHITPNNICIFGPLLEAGARVRVAPCNPDSTDDRTASHLASMGVEIRGRAGMSAVESAEALAWLASEPADALCDMGGELIVAMATAGYLPTGALEATTTGLHRLAAVDIPFPVLDWNGIALKDLIHNRHHVGAETWPAFSAITGLSLYGREIVVVGFGPVGQGVALRGPRSRRQRHGGRPRSGSVGPRRSTTGCRVADFDEAVRRASVIVTATGVDGVVGAAQIERLADGAILMNVGHSPREIDVDWLDLHPHTELRRHLERFEVNGRRLHLLNRGSLVNLAVGLGAGAAQLFDPFAAIMLLGLDAILHGSAGDLSAGVQRYPSELETRVARALVEGVTTTAGSHRAPGRI